MLKSQAILKDNRQLLVPSVENIAQRKGISIKTANENLDLVIFHSAPLIQQIGNRIVPMHDSNLDFDVERRLILDTLKRNNIGVDIRFDAATTQKLMEVMDKRPKLIHISCHGYYDEGSKNNFFLAFEHHTQVGYLDPVTTERLAKLLSTTKSYMNVVFVSACYSGAIGQVFIDAGFPCVICVHSKVQILDDAAQRFASGFYRSILTGKSIGEAFDSSVALVKDQQTTMIDACCCSHVHKPGCLWYSKMNSGMDMHAEHIPNCRCVYANDCIHSMSCPWALEFVDKY